MIVVVLVGSVLGSKSEKPWEHVAPPGETRVYLPKTLIRARKTPTAYPNKADY